MKNNKKILIIVVIIILIIMFFLLSIFIGRKVVIKTDEKDVSKKLDENVLNESKENELKNVENNSVDYTKIVTNSKIGVELQELLRIANLYSDRYYKILDTNGKITDEAKRIFTYSRIVTDENYKKYIRYSENYVGSYITKKDFDKVSKEIFGNDTNLDGKDVISENDYDKENDNYIISPMGLCGNDINITLDVPYKMLEYDDIIEVYSYRFYIIQNALTEENKNFETQDMVYSDYERQNLVMIFNDDTLQDEVSQTYNLLEKIEENNINVSNIKKVMYTIKVEGNKRYIKDCVKI